MKRIFKKINALAELTLAIWFVRFGLSLTESAIEKFELERIRKIQIGDLIVKKYQDDVVDFLSELNVFQNFLSHIVLKNGNYINKKIERKIENIFKRIDDDIYHCHRI